MTPEETNKAFGEAGREMAQVMMMPQEKLVQLTIENRWLAAKIVRLEKALKEKKCPMKI